MALKRYKATTTDKSRYFWNMAGSLCSALSSLVLLSIVSRINGANDGGIFSIAFTTAQLLSTVGVFEARAIQSTDVTEKFSFPSYFSMRILSCAIMLACGFAYSGYIFFSEGSTMKALTLMILCLYKAIDSFADVFQGMFQVKERIDLSGKELTFRVSLSTVAFFIILATTHNLLLSCFSMVLVSILWFIYYDIGIGRDFVQIKVDFDFTSLKKIAIACFPLFIGVFMFNFIVNAPKYAIDAFMNEEIQNAFGFLIMPASVINLFSLFFFRPLLTKMAHSWNDKDISSFNKIIFKCFFWIVLSTIGALVGAYIFGIPILNLFSGQNLNVYKSDLLIIMIGGGASAAITLTYYILTCMRKQYYILVGYIFGFISSIILSNMLVKSMEIRGACIASAVSALATLLPLLGVYFVSLRKEKNRKPL